MPWLFAAILCLASGSSIEGFASNPALRPYSRAADLIWHVLSGLSSLAIVVAFIYSFFVIPWWAVLLNFFLAGFISTFVSFYVRRRGMAPLYSQVLILVGLAALVPGLGSAESALFV
jgi:hypothetical protein